MPRALLAGSNTSSNIGNAFFYEGVKHALGRARPELDVITGLFPPTNAYRLRPRQREYALDYFAECEGVDVVAMAGPVLDRDFGAAFGRALRRARKAGKKILLLSAGGRRYDNEEISHCRRELGEIAPDILITRDTSTFDTYQDLAARSFDAICFAFFVSDLYRPYPTPGLQPYIVATFDFGPEPPLTMIDRAALADPARLRIAAPNHGTRGWSSRLAHFVQRRLPANVNGLPIIRPCHRPHRPKQLIFFRPNAVSSFVHEPYLNLYANAALTLSDRLHAAVAALAFGGPVRLFLESNRVRLLERARCDAALRQVYVADARYLAAEKRRLVAWLGQALGDLLDVPCDCAGSVAAGLAG